MKGYNHCQFIHVNLTNTLLNLSRNNNVIRETNLFKNKGSYNIRII